MTTATSSTPTAAPPPCVQARCGDGIRRTDRAPEEEGFEACDDGNNVDTDACRAGCLLAVCGDGVVRTDLEEGAEGFEVR